MLIVCEGCDRQLDTEDLEPGKRIRCFCGRLLTVPRQRSHTARVLHCSACGGRLRENASRCEYCGGAISLDERNLGVICPKCFARLHRSAKFCRECGIEIRPEAIQARRADSKCPRCQEELTLRIVEEGQYTECGGCGGIWLAEEAFEKVVEERDDSPLGKVVVRHDTSSAVEVPVHEVKYLPCPVCGSFMNRKNFGGSSGVVIDWCKGHGFWFDNHELEKIVAFVSAGGLDQARARELRRARHEIRKARALGRQRPGTGRGAYASSPALPPVSPPDPADELFTTLVEGLGRVFRGIFGR